MGTRPGRRLLIPETVQSSAMDCGPAVLRSLLAGFGVEVGYGRLREACQTGVDGTSIDAIEELAARFGLEVEQVMLPPDHLLVPAARALPAVVVVLSGGVTHFVIAWRRHGSRLQVMDPTTGRRWPAARRFLDEVYLHRHAVAAADWREWVEGPEAAAVARARLERLGTPAGAAARLLEAALAAPGWRPPAALDAAVRLCESLAGAGAIRRGAEAAGLAARLAEEAAAADDPLRVVPEPYWSVTPPGGAAPEPGSPEEMLVLRGAVLVRALGRRETPAGSGRATAPPGTADPDAAPGPLPARLSAAAAAPERGPMRRLLGFFLESGRAAPAALAAAAAAAALLVAFEALLLNGLVRAGGRLAGAGQLPAALAGLLAFAGALGLLELAAATGARDLGRHLEARLRLAFLAKIPLLGDRWFRSRLPSDLAERGHSAAALRTLPEAGAGVVGAACELAATAAALAWLFPGTAPLAAAAAAVAVAVPLALQPFLGERELRLRGHAAALARLQLDALLGLLAVRAHGAEPVVRRQHDEVLERWRRAGLGQLRGAVAAFAVQAAAGYGLAAALVALHVGRHGVGGGLLLLAYWALKLPELGGAIAAGLERIPSHRAVAVRLLEPLGAPEDEPQDEPPGGLADGRPAAAAAGVAASLRGVTVAGGGGPILDGVDLDLAAGSRVAVLGRSGAGKSTLLGLLLGFQRPSGGAVWIDGEPLDAAGLPRLRAATAWVDPAVRLWNRPLLENLRYGAGGRPAPLGRVLDAAGLGAVVEALPEGLATRLGEGGGLVSGGEGQRVRFGRALGRATARLVVLDEPFRGLDRGQRLDLLAAARAWWPHATLVCATHDAAAVRDFDRVVILEGGRVAEAGAPAELAARPGSIYARLLAAEGAAWDDPEWRPVRLAGGRIADAGPEAGR